ncbi:hypothetical protein FHG68_09255 [Leptospira weilii]|nr:hypothetical protein FHG67_12995 [Leptospira weilii]QDK28713.1 hypothetical protein FHG68_09255 [Leptospira weilii]
MKKSFEPLGNFAILRERNCHRTAERCEWLSTQLKSTLSRSLESEIAIEQRSVVSGFQRS